MAKAFEGKETPEEEALEHEEMRGGKRGMKRGKRRGRKMKRGMRR